MTNTFPAPARAVAAAAMLLVGSSDPAASQRAADSVVDRPLATRAALTALAERLERHEAIGDGDSALSERVETRLRYGDLRPGDRVLLEVFDEPALSDTFTVDTDRHLRFPPPAIGGLSVHGVLRSELETHVATFLGRFLKDPSRIVAVSPLVRLSVQGEVARAGYYEVPVDAVLADAVKAAGGTTADANMDDLRIERMGEPIWKGAAIQRALADRSTVDDMRLQDGDQIVVTARREVGLTDSLRFLWIVVSLAGGVYGLSRAF